MKVIITSQGFGGKGRYIGRSKNIRLGIFGNPYPTKKSKFSKEIYPLQKSLELYAKWIEKQYRENPIFKEETDKLVRELKEKGEVVLDCFCANLEVASENHKPQKCHGEVLAVFLLKLSS